VVGDELPATIGVAGRQIRFQIVCYESYIMGSSPSIVYHDCTKL
jgi:hypothetical protein